MNKVDAWSKANQTSGVIEDGVEVSEERFSENPGVFVVILEWQETLILLADIDNVGLWYHFHVVSIVNEKRDILIQVDVAWTVKKTIVIASDIRLIVEESAEHLSTDGVRDLNEWVERIEKSLLFWEIESGLGAVFKGRLVTDSESVDGDFPLLVIWGVKVNHRYIWDHL